MSSFDSTLAPTPVIFTYPESVFSRRLSNYLTLRHIPHTHIRVPPNMPRPILERLKINYRRIPILAIGRSIHIDTRHIISKLEQLYPDSPTHRSLTASDPFLQAVEKILEGWVIDSGPFWRASGCLPPEAPLLKSKEWMEDRSDGSGGTFNADTQRENRAWCLSQLRVFLSAIEGMLSDGRNWLLGGESPGLAELHAWAFDWIVNIAADMFVDEAELDGAMKDIRACLSEKEFPLTHAWVKRWRELIEKEEKTISDTVEQLEGQQAEDDIVNRILSSKLVEDGQLVVEEGDCLGLKRGQRVSVGSTDFGFTHTDIGNLVGLTRNEVVIEVGIGDEPHGKLRLHFPRVGYKILAVD